MLVNQQHFFLADTFKRLFGEVPTATGSERASFNVQMERITLTLAHVQRVKLDRRGGPWNWLI